MQSKNKQPGMFKHLHAARSLWLFMRMEMNSPIHLPLSSTLWAWRHGYLRNSAKIYGIDESNYKDYLNDFEVCKTVRFINNDFAKIFNNSIIFERFFCSFESLIPKNYFFTKDGEVSSLSSDIPIQSKQDILELIYRLNGIVIKPLNGKHGKKIYLIEVKEGKLVCNNKVETPDQILNRIYDRSGMVACERVHQSAYAQKIFPDSVNSIHMLTMWDNAVGEPFVASAFHRFGTKSTIPTDHSRHEGVAAPVNLDSGILGAARCSLKKDTKLTYSSIHPETGEQVEGKKIPDWTGIKKKVLEIAKSIPFAPHVGWDVVKTEEGMKILAGSNQSCITELQMIEPLLRNPRIRQFYETYGIR